MADKKFINDELIDFVAKAPTAFHATQYLKCMLLSAGFTELFEGDQWDVKKGKFFVIRNDSSIIAFKLTGKNLAEVGLKMSGAHTDSPSLRVKPNPDLNRNGYFQLAVEPYGGAIFSTWFDRALSLAGRVSYLNKSGEVKHKLIDFNKAIATIPSLAIHLDRTANTNKTINKQTDLPPVLGLIKNGEKKSFNDILSSQVNDSDLESILDHELYFYDTQRPSYVGIEDEFISSARIDNLYSCYLSVKAVIDSGDCDCVSVCNDHEECGSSSHVGAGGTFLKDILQRVVGVGENFIRAMHHSTLISADNAHAIHPNYASVHEPNHMPLMNGGPVIKINSNQRYATSSKTSASVMSICKKLDIPYQVFVAKSDMGCGSTIGPITSTLLGIETLDIGLPTFAMHSIRELIGDEDSFRLYSVLKHFNEG